MPVLIQPYQRQAVDTAFNKMFRSMGIIGAALPGSMTDILNDAAEEVVMESDLYSNKTSVPTTIDNTQVDGPSNVAIILKSANAWLDSTSKLLSVRNGSVEKLSVDYAGNLRIEGALIAKNGPWIDVRAYGAVGDFVTDDTAAIQLAIDAARDAVTADPQAVATVYIPAGHYLVNGQLLVESDQISIVGDGMDVSRLEAWSPPGPVHPMLKVVRNGTYLSESATYTSKHFFRDFGLRSDQWGNVNYLLDLVYPADSCFERLHLAGGGSPLRIQYSIHCVVKDCIIQQGLGVAGIFMDASVLQPSTTTRFENCYIQGNKIGYRGGATSGMVFDSCIFESNTQSGIELGEAGDKNDSVYLLNCHFEANARNIAAGASAWAPGGVLPCSTVHAVNTSFLPGGLATGAYVFDLGNAEAILDGCYIVPTNSSSYTFRVNRSGTTTTYRVLIDGSPYPSRVGYGENDGLQANFAVNEGTDSPFCGFLGSEVFRITNKSGATINVNTINDGSVIQATLSANTAVNEPFIAAPGASPLTPAIPGQKLTFFLTQDGTGGRTVTWNSVFKQTWSDIGNVAGKQASISFVFDGTDWRQIAYVPWNGNSLTYGAAAPVAGAHSVGEIIFNSSPSAGGNLGWVCVSAGTPGTFKEWGIISL